MGFLPVQRAPRKRPLPAMGFFARAPSRKGRVPGQALAPRKRPLPEMGFFAGAPAGNGLLILQFLAFWAFISLHFGRAGLYFLSFPARPLPSANDPCLK